MGVCRLAVIYLNKSIKVAVWTNLMSWDVPEMYIERSLGKESENKIWSLVAKPWPMFTGLEYCKTFLLGHGKYGSYPAWEPVNRLKGLPENRSKTLNDLIEAYDYEIKDATYLTLSELKEIDLEQKMDAPDAEDIIETGNIGRYHNFWKLNSDGEKESVDYASLEKETVKQLIKKEEKNIDGVRLTAERKRRSHYASGFNEMLEFMEELQGDGKYNPLTNITEDDVRLVIWV